MPNWQVVSKEKHGKSGWVPPVDYRQAKGSALAPLMAAEISHALPFYPLAFVKAPDGQFQLSAIFSLKNGVNLFVNKENRWLVPYVPAALRSYPFAMMKTQSGSHVLAVDVDSPYFKESASADDNSVLTSEGKADGSLETLIQFMQQRLDQQMKTEAVVGTLADFGLLEPWEIQVKQEDGSLVGQTLAGLYRVSEKALKKLEADKLSLLANNGALGIAYGQLLSQARLKDLQSRSVLFNKQNQESAIDKVNFDKIFDGESEDLFSF